MRGVRWSRLLGGGLRAGGWLAGFWLLWRLPAPDGGGAPGAPDRATPAPRLSVIVPARNEAARLPHLLRSLRAQRVPADEILVVDDHSTDGTASLARAAGASVLASAALPAGWTGKTWACHQAAAVAGGDLLCFLDADVTLAPYALERLRRSHGALGGLISVQPFHATERGYEALSAVCNLVELMGTGAFSGAPRRPAPMAFGPCLLIGRDDYRRIGGHAHPTVRPLVAEDIGLAARCRAEGIAVTNFAGRDVVAFRMYPGGVDQLVEGWSKMLAFGAGRTPPALAAAIGVWVTASLVTVADVARRRRGSAAAYLAWMAQMAWMLRRVGRFPRWTVPAWPVPLASFVALCARSAVLRRGVHGPVWRGRVTPELRPSGNPGGAARGRPPAAGWLGSAPRRAPAAPGGTRRPATPARLPPPSRTRAPWPARRRAR